MQLKRGTDLFLICTALVLAGERLCVILMSEKSSIDTPALQAGLWNKHCTGVASFRSS